MGETFAKPSVSLAWAERLAQMVIMESRRRGLTAVVAVVDESGILKVLERMDGASHLGVQTAQDKAFTAAGLGMATHRWFDFIQTVPALASGAACGIDRNIIFGGGLPLVMDGHVVGGLGVVAGTPDDDVELAEAALQASERSEATESSKRIAPLALPDDDA